MDTGLDALKADLKNAVHETAEATREFIRNKITDAGVKSYNTTISKIKHVNDKYIRNFEETVIPPEKREESLNKLRQVL